MSRYRKLPVEIDATQWFKNGDHPNDAYAPHYPRVEGEHEGLLVRYFRRPDVPDESICSECGCTFHVHGWIDTKEDGHRVCPGDWIITGVAGEHYPCKPDIFTKTYERVGG